MNSMLRLLSMLNPLEINQMTTQSPTIISECDQLGITVAEDVEITTISPGVSLFIGFDRHLHRMIRYKAIELGDRLIIETY